MFIHVYKCCALEIYMRTFHVIRGQHNKDSHLYYEHLFNDGVFSFVSH